MTPDELREAVARAIRGDLEDEAPWDALAQSGRDIWLEYAAAALRVVREAVREPTRRMLTEGDTALNAATFLGGNKVDPMREAWRAMLAASPIGGNDE